MIHTVFVLASGLLGLLGMLVFLIIILTPEDACPRPAPPSPGADRVVAELRREASAESSARSVAPPLALKRLTPLEAALEVDALVHGEEGERSAGSCRRRENMS